MELTYEPLYICAETDEGPRSGIAGYGGQPHFFQSDYLDLQDCENPGPLVCALVPLDLDTFHRLRRDLALVHEPRCIFAQVVDLDQVTVSPEMLPTDQDAVCFAKAWDRFRWQILRAVPEALRLVCEPRPRWMREGENECDFRECAAYEVAWMPTSPARFDSAGLAAVLAEQREVRLGLDPAEEGLGEGEDMPF